MKHSYKNQLKSLQSIHANDAWKSSTRDFLMLQARNTKISQLPHYSITQFLSFPITQFRFFLRPLTTALSVVLFVLVSSGFVVNAAKSSLPGDTLYPIKITSERLQVSLTWKEESRATLELQFAENRLGELEQITKSPTTATEKKGRIERAVEDFNRQVETAKGSVAKIKSKGDSEATLLVASVEEKARVFDEKLREVQKELPEDIQKATEDNVEKALQSVSTLKDEVQQHIAEGQENAVANEEVQLGDSFISEAPNKGETYPVIPPFVKEGGHSDDGGFLPPFVKDAPKNADTAAVSSSVVGQSTPLIFIEEGGEISTSTEKVINGGEKKNVNDNVDKQKKEEAPSNSPTILIIEE